MSPSEFIDEAYAAVRKLTDSTCKTQMHRRAATGRALHPFVHSTGVVTMRLDGQYVDYGVAWHGDNHPHAPGKAAGDEFAQLVEAQLAGMEPPVPGEIYERPQRGGARPATRPDDARVRDGGPKVGIGGRMTPATLERAKLQAARTGESLGAYLERLVLDDLGDKQSAQARQRGCHGRAG